MLLIIMVMMVVNFNFSGEGKFESRACALKMHSEPARVFFLVRIRMFFSQVRMVFVYVVALKPTSLNQSAYRTVDDD